MRDKLITLTVIVLFALFLAWAAPQVDALAASMGNSHKVIECAAGYDLQALPDGGVRIAGLCAVVKGDNGQEPVRPDYVEIELVGDPVYEYPYPVPEPAYPEPEDNECTVPWIWGESCE